MNLCVFCQDGKVCATEENFHIIPFRLSGVSLLGELYLNRSLSEGL